MKISKLKWDSENKYWICENCGAIYEQPENWEPPIYQCMKCKVPWLDYKKENENAK